MNIGVDLRKHSCGVVMKPLVSVNNPYSSEWYCEGCHVSEQMSGEEYHEFRRVIDLRNAKQAEAGN